MSCIVLFFLSCITIHFFSTLCRHLMYVVFVYCHVFYRIDINIFEMRLVTGVGLIICSDCMRL